MATSPIVFPYKPLAGLAAPLIPVGVCIGDVWRKVDFYVDSGAFYTILGRGFAAGVDFDVSTGQRVLVQVGDGSFIPVFLHKLPLQIGSCRIEATVGFSEQLRVPFHLLGRTDIFTRFKICFHEKQGTVTFEPVEQPAKPLA